MGILSRFRRKRPQPPIAHVGGEQDLYAVFRLASIKALNEASVGTVVSGVIPMARKTLEELPGVFGEILAAGTRDAGTIEHAARSAEREYQEVNHDFNQPPVEASARVPARIFMTIAYGQPYFDGNKRTGFLAGAIVAGMLGFRFRDSEYAQLAEEVRLLSARDAPVDEVAQWFLQKVLILPNEDVSS